MKHFMTTLVALTAWATPAIAGGGMETENTSLITILLLGFGAVIVVFQLIPGLVIFCGMVKGLFESATKTL
jgi:hypothetical protein